MAYEDRVFGGESYRYWRGFPSRPEALAAIAQLKEAHRVNPANFLPVKARTVPAPAWSKHGYLVYLKVLRDSPRSRRAWDELMER